jgi:ABC-type hemin transport system ATPase subunit
VHLLSSVRDLRLDDIRVYCVMHFRNEAARAKWILLKKGNILMRKKENNVNAV